MFELSQNIELSTNVSPFSGNLSICYYEPRMITYAAICGKYQVNLLQWEPNFENIKTSTIPLLDKDTNSSLFAVQVKFCTPVDRNYPILVVTTAGNIQMYDVEDEKLLISVAQKNEVKELEELSDKTTPEDIETFTVARGITCVDNYVYVGTHSGTILTFSCSDSVSIKKPLNDHKYPIIGLATCLFDFITISADVNGNVAVWNRNMKGVQRRMSVGANVSCINILRKQALCGTYRGQILLFSVVTGELMAEVTAHAREVTSVSVAPESAYFVTSSHDGQMTVWKLHTRKPDAYQVEFRHCEKVLNRSITCAQFVNARGNAFAAVAYDFTKLHIFRILKKR